MSQVLEAKKIESMADVEIGHILSASWGYDQTNIDYYKVIRKTATMVEVRAIGQKHVESASSMSEYVMPDPDNELFETDYMKRSEAEAKGFQIVDDHWCEGEYVNVRFPAISKHKATFDKHNGLCIKFASYKYAYSWDGKKDFQSHWA
jgi:hypothetical protein